MKTRKSPNLTSPKPLPQEGWVRRVLFNACRNALKAGRTGTVIVNDRPLSDDEMRRLVAYAERHGFLN